MKKINTYLAGLGLFLILGQIFLASEGFTYDEPHYLSNVDLIEELGLGKDFLKKLKGPAGPLHAYLHYFLLPITKGSVIPTRLVNVGLSILIVFLLYKMLEQLHPEYKHVAFLYFVIPMVYKTTGMALTEVPAMAFFTFSLYVIVKLFNDYESSNTTQRIAFFVFAGLIFSLAISGRQPYLVCLGGLAPVFVLRRNSTDRLGTILLWVAAVAYPLFLFYIWQGFAPEKGGTVATREPLKPFHVFIGLGYAFTIMMLIAPRFFVKPTRRLAAIYGVLFVAFIILTKSMNLSYIFMYPLMAKFLSEAWLGTLGLIFAAMLILVGIYFLQSLFQRTFERRTDLIFFIFSVMLFFLLLSNIAVTHRFSSRYVLQAAPLFLLLSSYFYEDNWKIKLMHLMGLILGAYSLMAFY